MFIWISKAGWHFLAHSWDHTTAQLNGNMKSELSHFPKLPTDRFLEKSWQTQRQQNVMASTWDCFIQNLCAKLAHLLTSAWKQINDSEIFCHIQQQPQQTGSNSFTRTGLLSIYSQSNHAHLHGCYYITGVDGTYCKNTWILRYSVINQVRLFCLTAQCQSSVTMSGPSQCFPHMSAIKPNFLKSFSYSDKMISMIILIIWQHYCLL